MSKHKRAGDEKRKVGKAGSPPSNTENEKPREEKDEERTSTSKVSKKDVGGNEPGGGLH